MAGVCSRTGRMRGENSGAAAWLQARCCCCRPLVLLLAISLCAALPAHGTSNPSEPVTDARHQPSDSGLDASTQPTQLMDGLLGSIELGCRAAEASHIPTTSCCCTHFVGKIECTHSSSFSAAYLQRCTPAVNRTLLLSPAHGGRARPAPLLRLTLQHLTAAITAALALGAAAAALSAWAYSWRQRQRPLQPCPVVHTSSAAEPPAVEPSVVEPAKPAAERVEDAAAATGEEAAKVLQQPCSTDGPGSADGSDRVTGSWCSSCRGGSGRISCSCRATVGSCSGASEGKLQPGTPSLATASSFTAHVSIWPTAAPLSPFAAQSQDLAPSDGTGLHSLPSIVSSSPPQPPTRSFSTEQRHEQQDEPLNAENATVLEELMHHRTVQESLSTSSGGGTPGSLAPTPQLVLAGLPPNLREWIVPRSMIEYLQRPDGSLISLGVGASGRVFKALYNGEIVAAKEMDIGSSLSSQQAFVTEALRLVLLRHSNVVSFYGVVLDGPRGILLCEFCEGRDLHSVLQLHAAGTQQRLFGWARRGRRVALEVARALNYLHSKSVVHMDIKSSNVLLSASGTAKLGDVGLSRLQTRTVMSDLSLIGTFAWVAPEILMGGMNCTRAVDIYSFGVLLYEIITGERPLRGNLRLPRVPEECPQAACNLMLECLSTDPLARPSAQELMQRLGEMVGGSASMASRPSLNLPRPSEVVDGSASTDPSGTRPKLSL